MTASTTVGWCPGALRPMASGDGLVLRVKPRGGRLSLDQAEAVAALAERFGNGHLDLTGRGNLQIRGARERTLGALTTGLKAAGLLDASPAAEAVRNIVASPLAGVDRTGFDTGPFLAALEHDLAAEARLQALPPKWSFVVDGGGRLPLAGVPADVRFRFDAAGQVRIGIGSVWAEELATPLDLPKVLLALARLVAGQPKRLRMRALLDAVGPGAVLEQLGLLPADAPVAEPAPVRAADLFGLPDGIVALGPAFGALPASTLSLVARTCRAAGVADLRLTPWRVMLATGAGDATMLRLQLAHGDLILGADDPRLPLTACVGAPACGRGTTATRADAAGLARRLRRDAGRPVHVSGCAKGCGRPPDAAWTLVARHGLYDLFRDAEAVPSAAGLSSTEAADWLSRPEPARRA